MYSLFTNTLSYEKVSQHCLEMKLQLTERDWLRVPMWKWKEDRPPPPIRMLPLAGTERQCGLTSRFSTCPEHVTSSKSLFAEYLQLLA